jgi:hypothetical protein
MRQVLERACLGTYLLSKGRACQAASLTTYERKKADDNPDLGEDAEVADDES